MKVYTSYFANIKKLDKDKYTFVSISRFFPYYMRGLGIKEYLKLAPPADLLMRTNSGVIDEEQYTIEFNEHLDTLEPENVIADLVFIDEDEKDVVLLCYEARDKFCHRHLVSKWLTDNGYIINEL